MAFKTGGSDELNSEINVTPMVDVMLVLLVIFMITAPLLNTGASVQLPEVKTAAIDDPTAPLVLTIDEHAKLKLGAKDVSWVELKDMIKANEKVQTEGQLYISAYSGLPYDVVVAAIAMAKDAGVDKVMALTSTSDNKELKPEDLDAGRFK
jgi:biopolymer transport protein TolR